MSTNKDIKKNSQSITEMAKRGLKKSVGGKNGNADSSSVAPKLQREIVFQPSGTYQTEGNSDENKNPRPVFRTTKAGHKLKMLPDEKETLPIDVDTQERGYLSAEEDPEGFSRLKDDINRFKRGDKNPLPRLTAYCFASSYKIREMSKWFLSKSLNTKSMIYDECLYLPNAYPEHFIIQHKDESANLTFHESTGKSAECHENDILIRNEAFLFDYGVAVLWGMTETMENEFLHNISQFALEMLDEEDQQCEDFNFFYDFSAQPRYFRH
ncbi:Sporulation protein RMD1 [Zancudomyces culisetae]|uniref:Sporulation protein RMD1 n=1 Tax=Zancudomyces culisetae TaxID=1213189 RepID=A0A1R1PGR2_ZANCU|nr:Sporulation protein RMD1 [Zancudomyces culisetae]OMH82586.1 Sporulation protein RMD1 [Zancudomyces culisetae]|eukprot:OMH80127.1 Sporulation protein RMD1 [Zancudomyces culisetae]